MQEKKRFNFTLLKAFMQVHLDKEHTTLKETLKPLKMSERKFNKILNNEQEFSINDIFLLRHILYIPDDMLKRVFFDKLEV